MDLFGICFVGILISVAKCQTTESPTSTTTEEKPFFQDPSAFGGNENMFSVPESQSPLDQSATALKNREIRNQMAQAIALANQRAQVPPVSGIPISSVQGFGDPNAFPSQIQPVDEKMAARLMLENLEGIGQMNAVPISFNFDQNQPLNNPWTPSSQSDPSATNRIDNTPKLPTDSGSNPGQAFIREQQQVSSPLLIGSVGDSSSPLGMAFQAQKDRMELQKDLLDLVGNQQAGSPINTAVQGALQDLQSLIQQRNSPAQNQLNTNIPIDQQKDILEMQKKLLEQQLSTQGLQNVLQGLNPTGGRTGGLNIQSLLGQQNSAVSPRVDNLLSAVDVQKELLDINNKIQEEQLKLAQAQSLAGSALHRASAIQDAIDSQKKILDYQQKLREKQLELAQLRGGSALRTGGGSLQTARVGVQRQSNQPGLTQGSLQQTSNSQRSTIRRLQQQLSQLQQQRQSSSSSLPAARTAGAIGTAATNVQSGLRPNVVSQRGAQTAGRITAGSLAASTNIQQGLRPNIATQLGTQTAGGLRTALSSLTNIQRPRPNIATQTSQTTGGARSLISTSNFQQGLRPNIASQLGAQTTGGIRPNTLPSTSNFQQGLLPNIARQLGGQTASGIRTASSVSTAALQPGLRPNIASQQLSRIQTPPQALVNTAARLRSILPSFGGINTQRFTSNILSTAPAFQSRPGLPIAPISSFFSNQLPGLLGVPRMPLQMPQQRPFSFPSMSSIQMSNPLPFRRVLI